MKTNNKGQALIEFVLILPIFIFMLFAVVDIGRIIYTKISLESEITDVVDLLEEDKNYDEIVKELNKNKSSKIELTLNYKDDKYVKIKLSNKLKFMTPGLNKILGNPYEVYSEKEALYEK